MHVNCWNLTLNLLIQRQKCYVKRKMQKGNWIFQPAALTKPNCVILTKIYAHGFHWFHWNRKPENHHGTPFTLRHENSTSYYLWIVSLLTSSCESLCLSSSVFHDDVFHVWWTPSQPTLHMIFLKPKSEHVIPMLNKIFNNSLSLSG